MAPSIQDRSIRVFISSTFQDMEQERNYLIKKVFPLLKSKASKRGVILTELDLRWGITQEESENGKVLEICLNEIDNSRPFFIGILGDRYGWCPSIKELDKNLNIEERYPWVRECINQGKSITEMEMLYGALLSKLYTSKNVDAFFWVKSGGTDENERLSEFKRLLHCNTDYPCSEYDNPEDLGEQVTAAFERILDERFPPVELTGVDQFEIEQDFFIKNHKRWYVPIKNNIKTLDDFVSDDTKRCLAIVGGVGCGKTSTIVNWLVQQEKKDSDCVYLSCFMQAFANGCDKEAALSYLSEKIRKILGIESKNIIENDRVEIEKEFERLLSTLCGQRPVLLVIAGLNVLDEPEEKLLNWLPNVPENSKLILSTTENDSTFAAIQRKGISAYSVETLSKKQRIQFVHLYLLEYGKRLNESQIMKIVDNPITTIPFLLRAILNELKNNGNFEKLNDCIETFSHIDSEAELYEQILNNAEEVFSQVDFKGALLSIAVSLRGLKESSILDLTKMAPLYWSQIYSAFSEYLISYNGFVLFCSSQLKEFVLQRYAERIKDVRNAILEVLDEQNLYEKGEMAYHYWMMHRYSELNGLLSRDVGFLLFLCMANRGQLHKYWRCIQETGQSTWRYYIGYAYRLGKELGNELEKENFEEGIYFYVRLCLFWLGVDELRLSWYHCAKAQKLMKRWHALNGDDDCFCSVMGTLLCLRAESLRLMSKSTRSIKIAKKGLRLVEKYNLPSSASLKLKTTIMWCYFEKKDYDNVSYWLDEIFVERDADSLNAYTEEEYLCDQIRLLIGRIELCRMSGDYCGAESSLVNAINFSKELIKFDSCYYNIIIDLLIRGGELYAVEGKFDKQKQLLEKSLDLIETAERENVVVDDAYKAEVLAGLAFSMQNNENREYYLNSAIQVVEQANFDSQSVEKIMTWSGALYFIVVCSYVMQLYSQTRQYMNLLYQLPPKFSNENVIWPYLFFIEGELFMRNGEYKDAIKKLTKSKECYQKLQDSEKVNLPLVLDYLARNYMGLGCYKKASIYFSKAICIYKESKDNLQCLILLVRATNLRCFCLEKMKKTKIRAKEIENMLCENFERFSQLNDGDMPDIFDEKCFSYVILSIVKCEKCEYEKAYSLINKAECIANGGNVKPEMISCVIETKKYIKNKKYYGSI